MKYSKCRILGFWRNLLDLIHLFLPEFWNSWEITLCRWKMKYHFYTSNSGNERYNLLWELNGLANWTSNVGRITHPLIEGVGTLYFFSDKSGPLYLIFLSFSLLGIESRALYMLGQWFTPEMHPQSYS